MKLSDGKIHCTINFVSTVDFKILHPSDYPPYSLDIYLKLLFQIVIFLI